MNQFVVIGGFVLLNMISRSFDKNALAILKPAQKEYFNKVCQLPKIGSKFGLLALMFLVYYVNFTDQQWHQVLVYSLIAFIGGAFFVKWMIDKLNAEKFEKRFIKLFSLGLVFDILLFVGLFTAIIYRELLFNVQP